MLDRGHARSQVVDVIPEVGAESIEARLNPVQVRGELLCIAVDIRRVELSRKEMTVYMACLSDGREEHKGPKKEAESLAERHDVIVNESYKCIDTGRQKGVKLCVRLVVYTTKPMRLQQRGCGCDDLQYWIPGYESRNSS